MATKKLFFLFSILLSMVGTKAWAYDIAVENADGVTIYYNYINDGKELEVTKGSYSGSVVIPDEVTYMNRTRKVTSIDENAFYSCSGLTSVTIGNNVTSIGGNAFNGCSSLTSVTIPNSVTSIGNYAFHICSSLTSVNISDIAAWCKISFGDNPLYYAHHLFLNGVEVKDLVIPNSVKSIGDYAFYNCSGLTSVTIPNSVASIGEFAFDGCSGLTSVTIPNSVTSMGEGVFCGCSGLTSVTISNSVTNIGKSAFQDCNSLTSITIPGSVISIGNFAFAGCNSLNSVTIPNSVTSIGMSAFAGCNSLNSVIIPGNVTSMGQGVFSGCGGLTSVTIDNGVTSIGVATFSGCSGLTSITIPNSVTSIGSSAFAYCSGLTSVTIGNGVTSIGDWAFAGCSGLTSVEIPNSVTRIGNDAFRLCSGLTSVTIGNGVTSIGDWAFAECDILSEVISGIENPFVIDANTFTDNTYYNASLYVPKGTIDKYKATEGWKKFVFVEEQAGSGNTPTYKLTYKVDGEVYKTYELAEGAAITPEPAPTKDGYTFSGWSDIPATMPAKDVIVTGTFSINKYKLIYKVDGEVYKTYDVEYGAAITPEPEPTKDGYTFSGWSDIPKTMPAKDVTVTGSFSKNDSGGGGSDDSSYKQNGISYKIIGSGTAEVSSADVNLTNANIVSSFYIDETHYTVTSIGKKAFYGCKFMTSVNIPHTVTSIGEDAFYGCKALTSIIIPSNVTTIAKEAFMWCSGLTTISIPASVTIIGESAFYGCWNLISISFPNSVSFIGNYAFYGCSSLKTIESHIVFPFSIEVNTFGEDTYKTAELVIPPGIKSDYQSKTGWGLFNRITEADRNRSHYGYDFAKVNADGVMIYYRYINDDKELMVWLDYGSWIHIDYESIDEEYSSNKCYTGNVIIPEEVIYLDKTMKVTSIGDGAFYYCRDLTSVTIPSTVNSIGVISFLHCDKLMDLYSYAVDPPSLGGDEFFDYELTDYGTLHVPAESIDAYKSAWYWKDFKNIVAIEGTKISTVSYDNTIKDVYSINGESRNTLSKGINIIRTMDGKTKKVFVK